VWTGEDCPCGLECRATLNVADRNATNRADVIPYCTSQRGMFVLHSALLTEHSKTLRPAERAPGVHPVCKAVFLSLGLGTRWAGTQYLLSLC
jgi:hypothetical protein